MRPEVEQLDLGAPEDVVWIAATLEKAGFETWAVGGAVRDALRGDLPEDWDLTTSAAPREIQRIFRRTVPIGIEYGTVGVIARSGRMYEVTTFRRDVETFGRRARVAFSRSLEEDLERRDFTINAVAWHPITKELRDPHGGRRDLDRGVLRTVGDPDQRFEEDRLRALRALRFAGRFDLRIDDATWRAVVSSAGKLNRLSAERIREELVKILSGQPRPSRTLELYAGSGILEALYPELEACRGVTGEAEDEDLWHRSVRATDSVSRRKSLVRLAALLHAVGIPSQRDDAPATEHAMRSSAIARDLLRRLRFSNADVDSVSHLVAQYPTAPAPSSPDPDIRRWLQRIGREFIDDMFRLLIALNRAGQSRYAGGGTDLMRLRTRVEEILRSGVPLTVTELPINGSDLLSLGLAPGPIYGEILREMLDLVTDSPELNQRDSLLDIVKQRFT